MSKIKAYFTDLLNALRGRGPVVMGGGGSGEESTK